MSETVTKRASKKRILLLLCAVVLILAAVLLSLRYCYGPIEDYPRDYEETVSYYAKLYDVPENLVYAVILTESEFDPDAVSHAGAQGLMQLMPATFRWLTDEMLFEHLPDDQITDPEVNIRYGVYYLRWLYDYYDSWLNACAAYNAGPGNVNAWLDNPIRADAGGTLRPLFIPVSETRNYVYKVERAYEAYEHYYPTENAPSFR